MAETAAILSTDKTVLIRDLNAGCLVANMITADQLKWKQEVRTNLFNPAF